MNQNVHPELVRFNAALRKDTGLLDGLRESARSPEELTAYANARGYAFTVEDCIAMRKAPMELSEEELDQVSGGTGNWAWWTWSWWK